jgi:hypothetical protein
LVRSVRCSRGVSRRVMEFAVCRTAFRLPRDSIPVQRFRPTQRYGLCGSDRPRSTFTVSGCVLRVFAPLRPASGFHATSNPLVRLSVSSKPLHSSTAPEWPDPGAPLLRSCPLQRSTETGARITRRVPTAGTVRPQGFSPSRRLSSPVTMAGLFHPTCVLGVEPGPNSARSDLSIEAGQTRPGFVSTAFSPPTTSTVFTCSPLVHFVRIPGEGELR